MTDPLATYPHDHLAGSNFAIQLLQTLRDRHAAEPLGHFAEAELAELEEERDILQAIIERVGKGGADLKEAAAWLAEKAAEFKLRHETSGELGTFEALETFSLGVMGRRALWRALAIVSQNDERINGVDYSDLAARAEAQHARVEDWRLKLAPSALKAAK